MLKKQLTELASKAGAQRIGFARSVPVDRLTAEALSQWLADGNHASMGYLANHTDIRLDPMRLLDRENPPAEGTVISMAFSYYDPLAVQEGDALLARYALGSDYHEVLRQRLQPLAELIRRETGKEARICVDTAPILERYWAVRAGVGFIGRNHLLIVPGVGSYCFLAEIVTDAVIEPDPRCTLSCRGCSACVRKCPGNALAGDFDCRRCLSYLTIEDRSEDLDTETAQRLGNRVYGCDTCQECCPHNRHPSPTEIEEFRMRPQLRTLSRSRIATMTQPEFSTLFTHSAVKRAKLAGLRRNSRRN